MSDYHDGSVQPSAVETAAACATAAAAAAANDVETDMNAAVAVVNAVVPLPPFDPPPPQSAPVQSEYGLGHSVVPDLMKVYESLTQSSTPQHPTAPPSKVSQEEDKGTTTVSNQNRQYQQQNYPLSQPHNQQYSMIPQGYSQQYINTEPSPSIVDSNGAFNPPPTTVESTSFKESNRKSGSRSTRKRSLQQGKDESNTVTTKGRKKANSDGRWSKRFTWPEELHRDFVAAIFDVGLKHSSPSALLEFMPEHEQLTSERIKSHLQKYRLHRTKSKKEFMTCYDESLGKFQMGGLDCTVKSLSSAEVPAHLTYSTIMDSGNTPAPQPSNDTAIEQHEKTKVGQAYGKEEEGVKEEQQRSQQQGGFLNMPQLTDAEKNSPIGASIGYLMGLFFSLKQQLVQQREEQALNAGVAATGDVGGTPGPSNVSVDGSLDTNQQYPPYIQGKWTDNLPPQPTPYDRQDTQPSATQQKADNGGSEAKLAAPSSASGAVLSNLEESNLMKREMQNQMAFQNKMRALKQQELNKYKSSGGGNSDNTKGGQTTEADREQTGNAAADKAHAGGGLESTSIPFTTTASEDTGQPAEARGRAENKREGHDDFWNSEALDEHLFEFLMNS